MHTARDTGRTRADNPAIPSRPGLLSPDQREFYDRLRRDGIPRQTALDVAFLARPSHVTAPPSPPGGQSLRWRQLMLAFAEIELLLLAVLKVADLPTNAKEGLHAIGAHVVAPILRRDGRRPVGDWPVVPGFLWRPVAVPELPAEQTTLPPEPEPPVRRRPGRPAPHLAGLTDRQLDDYRVLRGKGRYSTAEALAMVQRPDKQEVRV
jgi:hypothetical protein